MIIDYYSDLFPLLIFWANALALAGGIILELAWKSKVFLLLNPPLADREFIFLKHEDEEVTKDYKEKRLWSV